MGMFYICKTILNIYYIVPTKQKYRADVWVKFPPPKYVTVMQMKKWTKQISFFYKFYSSIDEKILNAN